MPASPSSAHPIPSPAHLQHLTDAELDAADAFDALMLQRVETTAEQDAAAWIHGRPERPGQVNVAPYDAQWPTTYVVEAQRIHDILGARALSVEHVGSTSVPGLAAKPIIDINLIVADSADEPAYVPDLEAAGYRLIVRELFWHQHRLLKGPAADINLHVFSAGSSEAERMVLLRDWMRAHDADRDLYAQTKLDLAQHNWGHLQEYTVSKDDVINDILNRAVAARRAARQAERERRAAVRKQG